MKTQSLENLKKHVLDLATRCASVEETTEIATLLENIERDFSEINFKYERTNKDKLIANALLHHTSQDLTKAWQETEESRQQYLLLANNSPLPVGVADLETGKILYINQRACDLFEITHDLITKSNVSETYVNPSEREKVLQLLHENGHVHNYDVQLKTASGREIWVLLHMVLTKYEGKPAIQTVFSDITERKQAEEALRESEERYRSFFDQASDGILLMSNDGGIVHLNEAFAQMHGYTVPEMIGMNIKDLDDPETFLLLSERLSRLGSGKALNFEVLHYHKDGHLFPIEVSARGVLFNGQYCIQSICRDITERKKAELDLEKSEKRARHLNDLLRAMYEIQHLIRNKPDEGNLLTGVCNVLVETRGYRAVWIGIPQNESKLVIPVAQAGQTSRILHEAPITWDNTPNGRGPCGTAVREWVPCIFDDIATDPRFEPWRKEALAAGCGSVASFPILSEKRLWGVITIKANRPNAFSKEEIELLTDLANEVGQALQSIEHRKERERLEEQYRQEQKMAAIGQLAGGVAHDFNNILGAHLLQIGLLMDCPDLTPEMRNGLEELEQGAFRASNLIRQLLMFSRRQAVQIKPLDIKAILESIHGMLSRLLGETVLLKLQTDAKPLWVKADQGMIEQVIVNLCVNARDAMPDGGKLTFKAEEIEIESGREPIHMDILPGKFVCLSVADTGHGIEPKDIKHIFEPFFTTKEIGKGTGLGLATVYGIVQQHGGWIEVESKLGKGTLFRVFLPVCEEENIGAATKGNQVPTGTEKILFVEDDEKLRSLVVRTLKGLGYQVAEAANGVDALKKWEEHNGEYDLLLTDMVMPEGMSGLELAQIIQRKNPTLKVIISSGYSNTLNSMSQDLSPGITLLPKPYGIPTIAKTIRQILDPSEAT